jgi:hypothetical protein
MTSRTEPDHHQKIKKIAGRLRMCTWLISALLLGLLVAGLVTGESLVSVNNHVLSAELTAALTEKSLYPHGLMSGLEWLQLAGVGLFLFWLQRLMGFFQRGDYFSNPSIRCYLWMAWVIFALLVLPGLNKLYLHYLCYRYLPETDAPLELTINFSSLVLLVLLPLIIYLLRIAQSLEIENREFV